MNNTIRYIFQDSKGFIWVSTVNGLNRYDGHSFVNFFPENDSEISIKHPHVQTITEDKVGFLWIAAQYNGYNCYDLEHDRFVDYTDCGEKIESQHKSSKEMAYPIQLMQKSTDRMLRLVNQLLEFRKMQNNKLTLRLEEADCMVFLRDISLNFEDTAADKEIDFRFTTSVNTYPMFIDRGKLDKIAYNLLSNAFKYTPVKGKIVFSVLGKQLILTVSDTGIGIPKEKQKELFSRFMQSSFSKESVGIGLHLTYELVATTIDKKFADRLNAIMEKQLANPNFTIEDFAAALNLGRTVFFRKVKGVTGYTPNEYMRIMRMKKAVQLLEEGTYNISEVAYMVGMNDPLYFSKCFKMQFGVSPSTYTRRKRGNEKSIS